MSEIITPPAHLPVTVSAADMALAAAVVEEIERGVLWRAIVRQTRKDRLIPLGPCRSWNLNPSAPSRVSPAGPRQTPPNVIDAASYSVVSRDPAGALIAPATGYDWPAPERAIGSFALTYMAGWVVTPETALNAGDGVNDVPASVRLMVERAVAFRAGSGVGDITIGSLKINVAPTYKTDRIPPEIAAIGRGYAYRPGLFSARP